MNSEFDQDKKSKQKSIIPKFTRIVDNKPPQRVPAPSTSVDITAPETIRTRKLIHQRRMRNNIPMTSISKEMVDVGKVRFNLSQQRVAKNSDNWRQQCLEYSDERETKKSKKNSLRQSNPQVIPYEHKQISTRNTSNKLSRVYSMRPKWTTSCPQEILKQEVHQSDVRWMRSCDGAKWQIKKQRTKNLIQI